MCRGLSALLTIAERSQLNCAHLPGVCYLWSVCQDVKHAFKTAPEVGHVWQTTQSQLVLTCLSALYHLVKAAILQKQSQQQNRAGPPKFTDITEHTTSPAAAKYVQGARLSLPAWGDS